MSKKNIVLSIRFAGQVRSWSGEAMLPARLVDPVLFEDPARLGLLSDCDHLVDPVLGRLSAHPMSPGTLGWVGLDVDNKRIVDLQHYTALGAYVAALGEGASVLDPAQVPSPLIQACLMGPWKSRAFLRSPRSWRTHPPLDDPRDWRDALKAAQVHAVSQMLLSVGAHLPSELPRSWLEIRPALPRGWRMAHHANPVHAPGTAQAAAAFERLAARLHRDHWGLDEATWPAWHAHAIDQLDVPAAALEKIQARLLAKQLSGRLPRTPRQSPAPRPLRL